MITQSNKRVAGHVARLGCILVCFVLNKRVECKYMISVFISCTNCAFPWRSSSDGIHLTRAAMGGPTIMGEESPPRGQVFGIVGHYHVSLLLVRCWLRSGGNDHDQFTVLQMAVD